MNITNLKILFNNTIQKESRSKALLFAFLFTLFMIIFVNLAINMIVKYVSDTSSMIDLSSQKIGMFYFIINSWTLFLSIIFGVNTIRSDLDSQVIDQILSFPIKRIEYLIARILGSFFIVNIYYLLSMALTTVIFIFSDDKFIFQWGMFLTFAVMSLSILSVITLSSLFSMFFNKIFGLVFSMMFCLVIFIANSTLGTLKFAELFKSLGVLKSLGVGLHFVFPRIGVLGDISGAFLSGQSLPFNLFYEGIHFILSYLVLFLFFLFVFKRQENHRP
ncbi:MAG: ABC transporter permease subunit [Bdellovibrionales bacterium]|jgi:ABC-type transport system involved in multi-copper enzyme maturation permease subunit|nr:ABC transporter permease subunit [Bdellovibrionales bacterium]